MFNLYPDFLQAEISELKNAHEDWENDFKTLIFGKNEESHDLDNSDQDLNDKNDDANHNVKWNKNLYLQTETRSQSFTDSCFEIQNLKSFVGGKINLGN